jgi:aminopeptidase-like protein
MTPGEQLALIAELAPLRRDLVSGGFDEALDILARRFPLTVRAYPTGTRAWTWTIPPRWTCLEARIESLDGRVVLDAADHPLHVASYSRSIDAVVSREELQEKLHVHPRMRDHPPFIFHYYRDDWGFCCPHSVKEGLSEPRYRVRIVSRFEEGALKVGEWSIPGTTGRWFHLGGHLCHPCQAADGLSGVVTALAAMEAAGQSGRRVGLKLLVTPETIGSVAWLAANEEAIKDMIGGLFLDMTGLDQPPLLQLSYHGLSRVDTLCRLVHESAEVGARTVPYRQGVGNDERQFNAPGVRVPMLGYSRALPMNHQGRPYAQYHSAADTADIISPAALARSADTVARMLAALEAETLPLNHFKGEAFLAGHGLALDRERHLSRHRDMLRVMDMIDGTNATSEIAAALGLEPEWVAEFLRALADCGLTGEEPVDRLWPRPGAAGPAS